MLRIVLSCVLVAMAAAECGPVEAIKVKTQWADAYGEGHHRLSFGQAVWRAFFRLAPESRDRFDRVNGDDLNSPEFEAHVDRVMGGLDMTISFLDDPNTLAAQLEHLEGQHIRLNIPGNYFDLFGRALMQVIPAAIGRCFDEDAWNHCFNAIADGIKH